MLTRLGDLLRMVLRQDSRPESTLREEIALTRVYVALEQEATRLPRDRVRALRHAVGFR